MVSTRYYLDTRASADREAPLKIAICKKGRAAYFNTGHRLLPEHWDAEHQKVIKHPARNSLNTSLLELMVNIRERIQKMVISGEAAMMTSTMIKDALYSQIFGAKPVGLKEYWDAFIASKTTQTAGAYRPAWTRAVTFCESRNTDIERFSLANCTKKWCTDFDAWLQENFAMNSRNVCICAWKGMFNQAIKDGLLRDNPMVEISQTYVNTRKRDLGVDQLRRLLSYEAQTNEESIALDAIRISFFMRAANLADICKLTKENMFNGRIEYDRSKTGKHYSVKIEPELQELMDRTRKGDRLFYFGKCSKVTTASVINKALKHIGDKIDLPKISFYWIRHTFASLAMDLEIPVDIIGAMLGHSTGARITMGYIDIKSRQIDEAARKVYDLVLSEK